MLKTHNGGMLSLPLMKKQSVMGVAWKFLCRVTTWLCKGLSEEVLGEDLTEILEKEEEKGSVGVKLISPQVKFEHKLKDAEMGWVVFEKPVKVKFTSVEIEETPQREFQEDLVQWEVFMASKGAFSDRGVMGGLTPEEASAKAHSIYGEWENLNNCLKEEDKLAKILSNLDSKD